MHENKIAPLKSKRISCQEAKSGSATFPIGMLKKFRDLLLKRILMTSRLLTNITSSCLQKQMTTEFLKNSDSKQPTLPLQCSVSNKIWSRNLEVFYYHFRSECTKMVRILLDLGFIFASRLWSWHTGYIAFECNPTYLHCCEPSLHWSTLMHTKAGHIGLGSLDYCIIHVLF